MYSKLSKIYSFKRLNTSWGKLLQETGRIFVMDIEGLFDSNELQRIFAFKLSEKLNRFRFLNSFVVNEEHFICPAQGEIESDKADSLLTEWNNGIGKSNYLNFKSKINEIMFDAPEKTLKAGDWIHYLDKV